MGPVNGIEDFDESTALLAKSLCRHVESQLPGDTWSQITLDVRYQDADSSFQYKLRIATPDGRVKSIGANADINLALISIQEIRAKLFHNSWFGLKLNIDRGLKCKIDLSYDSEHPEGNSFFDV